MPPGKAVSSPHSLAFFRRTIVGKGYLFSAVVRSLFAIFLVRSAWSEMAQSSRMSLDLHSVKQLLGRVQDVKCYFVRVKSTPQSSTFTGLATTLQYEDEYAGEIPLLKLFSITPETLDGSNSDVNNAVDQLVRVLSLQCQDELARHLEGASEKKQMVAIVHLLLQRLCSNVVVNKQAYSAQFLAAEHAAISRGWLGMGTRLTWRGAPDCRCTVDIVSTDKVIDDESSMESDSGDSSCSSAGTQVTVEGKKANIGLYEMNQVVGHAVTYGFIHANRHPSQNPFIPAIGLSGSRCTLMAAFYCPVTDVLIHLLPDEVQWFDIKKRCFVKEGVFVLWLLIYHALFLNRLSGHEVTSNLQKKFDQDTLAHFHALRDLNKEGWGAPLFPRKLVKRRISSSSSSSSFSSSSP